MLATRHIVGLSLLAALLGGPTPSRTAADVDGDAAKGKVRITFAVAEGTKLRKTFAREIELKDEGDSWLELGTWHDSQRIVLLDEYGPVEEQIPTTITRSFECIEMEHSHDWKIPLTFLSEEVSGVVEREGTGELVGLSVTFTRDYAEPEIPFGMPVTSYVAAVADDLELSDDAVARLAELRANTDGTGLLPWREVAIGDPWFVDVDSFRELCWPSGALRFLDSDGERMVTPVDERLGKNLDGTFRVELVAVERVAGRRLAQMSIRGILESQATFHYDWHLGVVQGLTLSYEGTITLGLYASLQGQFWWDLDAGHLESLHIEGDVIVEQDLGEIRWDEWGMFLPDITGSRVWTGKLSADAEFERL